MRNLNELRLTDGRHLEPDAWFDAGDRGSGDGLLLLLKQAMRGIGIGEVLALRATAPSAATDLPAWCRLDGHQYLGSTGDGHYALRRGGVILSLNTAPETLEELWIFPVSPTWCNLECTHCLYAASPRKRDRYRITNDELLGLIDQFEAIRVRPHLMITGGEPTLHTDLVSLLRILDERGYSFQLMTNATMITEGMAADLAQLKRLRKVQVSVEGDEPEINDRVYGKGVWQRTLTGIRRLRTASVPVAIAVTPMAENESRLAAIEQLARDEQAEVKYILLYPLGAANQNGIRPAAKDPPRVKGDGRLMCDKGVAYSEGAFYPCTVLAKEPWARIGATLEEALGDAARARVRTIRKSTPACEVCKRGSS